MKTKAAGEVLTAKLLGKNLTGSATPWRSVCAPVTMSRRWYDQAVKQIDSWASPPGDPVRQAIAAFRAEVRELLGVEKKKD